jgi:hypothetical protein
MRYTKHMLFLAPLSLLWVCAPQQGQAQTPSAPNAKAPTASAPILIELFTSEGCSSCPPADSWLQKLDEFQPIPGGQAIVLSEHVDYWNHDGWKDPYSSSSLTDRQNEYERAMGLSQAVTPQVIVNGTVGLPLGDPKQLGQLLLKAAKAPQAPVRITAVSLDGDLLRAHIEVDGTSDKHNADVLAAIALDHAESQVLHGENGGKHLTHAAVVQELTKIGKLEKGKTFVQDYQVKLKPGADPKNLRLIVFVQVPGPGEVLGAARQELAASNKVTASIQ